MSTERSTTTIYARVPSEVKEQVDAFVKEYGMTLAAGVSVLLSLALRHAKEICPTCHRELEK